MKAFKLIILLALFGCEKEQSIPIQTRQVEVTREGYFYNDRTMNYDWIDETTKLTMNVGDTLKQYIVSNPKYVLAGQKVWVYILVDNSPIYDSSYYYHNINIVIQ